MTAILLHGAAARRFGPRFDLDVKSPSEAFHALMKMVPGFKAFISAADWKIIKGPTARAVREGRDCDETDLPMRLGRVKELHLIPVPAGAKKSGIGKIVAGVAIIALTVATAGAFGAFAAGGAGLAASVGSATVATSGFAITYANIAMFGASMVLGGISQMLAGNPRAQQASAREDSTQRVNSLFSGPVNVGELGQAIPLTYSGPDGVLVGSVVGSAGLTTEQTQLAPTSLPGNV